MDPVEAEDEHSPFLTKESHEIIDEPRKIQTVSASTTRSQQWNQGASNTNTECRNDQDGKYYKHSLITFAKYILANLKGSMEEDFAIFSLRLYGLSEYDQWLQHSAPASSELLQDLIRVRPGSQISEKVLGKALRVPHFLLSQHLIGDTAEDPALLEGLARTHRAEAASSSWPDISCPLTLSYVKDKDSIRVHIGILGSAYHIDPVLYEVALEFMRLRERNAKDVAEVGFRPELVHPDICILQISGNVILLRVGGLSSPAHLQASIYNLFALFIPSSDGSSQLAWVCWNKLRAALRVTGSPGSGNIAETACHLGRCWLQVLWSDYTMVGIWTQGLLNDVEKIDRLQAYSRALFNIKAGYTALQSWIAKWNAQSKDRTAPEKQQSLFEDEYRAVITEASCLGEYIDRHVALQSLAASRLSILESRRGIEVSERAIKVTEKAERQAHAIGRLTQLAFVFLPLTFVTGVFGMNIKPFTEGAPLWKFWVTVACVVVPAFLFGLQTARKDITDRWKQVRRIPKVVRHSMMQREFGDYTHYPDLSWIDKWIGLGDFASYQGSISAPSYDDFLDDSGLQYVLLGVGFLAAAKSAFRRVRRKLGKHSVN